MRIFIDWFGQPPAIKIRYYSSDYRGIHAAVDIKAGSTVLFVPEDKMLTVEKAEQTEMGKIIVEKNLRSKLIDKNTLFELMVLIR